MDNFKFDVNYSLLVNINILYLLLYKTELFYSLI